MAAITTAASPMGSMYVRTGTAQADTGQVDWLLVPKWATWAQVILDVTTITATSAQLALKMADPTLLNDTQSMGLAETAAFTAMTGACMLVVDIGPGILGIANDVTNSATVNSYASVACLLPGVLGLSYIEVVGAGTVTYKLSCRFVGK